MEAIGITARLSQVSALELIAAFDQHVFAPALGAQEQMSLARRALATWIFLYIGSLLVYFLFASLDYFVYYYLLAKRLHPPTVLKTLDVRREIFMSVTSLLVMSAMSTPAEILIQLGYSKEYTDPALYGYPYLIISPLLFIAFSDCIIYFIHRALHTRWLYRHVHKPHHSFINTSPFAAFAFHPVDGYMQGVSYHIFVFLFPFHSAVHLVSLIAVSMWTINIHDRVNFAIPGINGAGHHTIHHTTYKSNYGQYFTLWDQICGTFRDPRLWKKQALAQPILWRILVAYLIILSYLPKSDACASVNFEPMIQGARSWSPPSLNKRILYSVVTSSLLRLLYPYPRPTISRIIVNRVINL